MIESIRIAKEKGARYRVGPELELPGYGCEDHFLELDTIQHSWECLCEILCTDLTEDIVCDIGMPVLHCGVRYNCRVFVLGRKIILIRPKLHLANDGNYRETRWFSAWDQKKKVEQLRLPSNVVAVTGQTRVPFGAAALEFADASIGCETCEELFTPAAPHIQLALNGIEIMSNGSGSHHQLRKLNTRMELIRSASRKCGGVYLYANQRGCDGGRLYYDGCACIAINGEIVAQGKQFAIEEVEVVTACVDLDHVTSFRASFQSMSVQAAAVDRYPVVLVPFNLCNFRLLTSELNSAQEIMYHSPEEEIALGPACWLWDYLRRSGASGYLLPLSGGADSSSTAAIVGSMCRLAVQAATEGDPRTASEIRRISQLSGCAPLPSAKEFAHLIFQTIYLGTENSSGDTRRRSAQLASEIGSSHLDMQIDSVVSSLVSFFASVTRRTPKFKIDGGCEVENLALQNIQARLRMVLSFVFAQLMPWVRGRKGFLLVLGSSNVDEGLRGYMTKYDCSSADVNPIGGISKTDLRLFLRWGSGNLGYPTLAQVERAPPTAELEPIRHDHVQTDEEDMGMTYDELGMYGRCRKIARLGPLSMFKYLLHKWGTKASVPEIAEKVKHFFFHYACNRHKMTTLTPSYHAECYSPEDNRFDLRPFLYNVRWPWQFRKIDEIVERHL